MNVQFKNKATGEIRDVEADSGEMRDLQAQVDHRGLHVWSLWEQTSYAHADAIKARAALGELDPEDLGKDHQERLMHAAVLLDAEGVAPEANPHLALTPGEIENGLTPRSKLADLKDMIDQSRHAERQAVLEEAADSIADERVERPAAQQARGITARAGGSDNREGAPTVKAPKDDADSAKKSEPTPPAQTGPRSAPQGGPEKAQ